MSPMKNTVTFEGNPLTLVGDTVAVGQPAPNVEVLDNGLAAVALSAYRDKVVIISSVPSLDTPVCDTQTRKFNEAVAALGTDAVVLTVSVDLPFAQARWCGAAGLDAVHTLSDHKETAFGTAYGVLIKELRLLARAVFVLDKTGVIQYIEVVDELTHEPNYDAALEAAKKLL